MGANTYVFFLVHFPQIFSNSFFSVPPGHVDCILALYLVSDDVDDSGQLAGLGYSPSIFARCKPLHTSGDGGIDQILLCLLFRVRQKLDEGQDGMNALKGLDEGLFVIVVRSTPGDLRCDVGPGSFLSVDVSVWVVYGWTFSSVMLTLLLSIVTSCFFAARRASRTSRDTSAKYISRCTYQCSIQDKGFDLRPEPPAMAILTIEIFLNLLHNDTVFLGSDFGQWGKSQL